MSVISECDQWVFDISDRITIVFILIRVGFVLLWTSWLCVFSVCGLTWGCCLPTSVSRSCMSLATSLRG